MKMAESNLIWSMQQMWNILLWLSRVKCSCSITFCFLKKKNNFSSMYLKCAFLSIHLWFFTFSNVVLIYVHASIHNKIDEKFSRVSYTSNSLESFCIIPFRCYMLWLSTEFNRLDLESQTCCKFHINFSYAFSLSPSFCFFIYFYSSYTLESLHITDIYIYKT